MVKRTILLLIVIGVVVSASMLSVKLWGGKSEEVDFSEDLVITGTMTIEEFGEKNNIAKPILKELFGLRDSKELSKTLSSYGKDEEIKKMVDKKLALLREGESKNWIKIPLKFGLWVVFLVGIFFYYKKRHMSIQSRIVLLALSVVVFGIILGSDPGPMGTVKDAIVLYGAKHVVFIPRMIAMTVFLLMVFFVNKFICAWGCQIGALQDLLIRLVRYEKTEDNRSFFKVPFVITNTIRVVFFIVITLVAIMWAFDIIGSIDPFKIFHPTVLTWVSASFIGFLLVVSMFIYRPWCHFFCPFGLIGWIVEKVSIVKITVDYNKCIACNKCTAACPSTVMEAILKRNKKTIPDCFACYSCREVCPVGAIEFSAKKRSFPAENKFDTKKM